MKLAQARITVQGQVSIPAEVRRRLGIGPGSVIEWDAEGDTVVIRRAGRHSSEEVHNVLFDAQPTARSLEELKAGIARNIRKRHARR